MIRYLNAFINALMLALFPEYGPMLQHAYIPVPTRKESRDDLRL
jgi:hypothetical protein